MVEREKRSWREIDRLRDGSAHRRDEGPQGARGRPSGSALSGYKRELERVFSGVFGGASTDPGSRQALLARIREAPDSATLVAAADAFVGQGYAWPDDVDVLVRLLDHTDESRVRDALERIAAVSQRSTFKRGPLLAGRLRKIEDLAEDPETRALAHRIRIGRS